MDLSVLEGILIITRPTNVTLTSCNLLSRPSVYIALRAFVMKTGKTGGFPSIWTCGEENSSNI
jgi:hypothetical protein